MDINITIKNVLRVKLKNLIKDEVIQEIADEVEAQCIRKNTLPYNISSKELREQLRGFEELSKYYVGEKPKDIPLSEVRAYIRDLETEARTKKSEGLEDD